MKTVERIKMSPNLFSQLFNDMMAANGEITEQNQLRLCTNRKWGECKKVGGKK